MELDHRGRSRRELISVVQHIAFQRDGFTVASLNDTVDGTQATVRGPDRYQELCVGYCYRFLGSWNDHPKYGLQFAFTTFCQEAPSDRRGVIAYLLKFGKGIGAQLAGRLVDHFGPDVITTLLSAPETVISSGILTRTQAEKAAESLQKEDALRRTRIDLFTLLDRRGFPRGTLDACLDLFGAAGPAKIRLNPFILLEHRIHGCGFARVDRLYRDLQLPLDDPKRQMYAAWHSVVSGRDGHTWVPLVETIAAIKEAVGPGATPSIAIQAAESSGLLTLHKEENTYFVADSRRAANEDEVCRKVLDLIAVKTNRWPTVDQLSGLDDHQREKVKAALSHPFGVLIGSPGTGKSHSLACIVEYLVRNNYRVGVCAPTGRAAVRITEFLRAKFLDTQASTIHSLLRVRVAAGGGWVFQHNEQNPLPLDFVFADEVSMLDTDLAASFFRAIRPGTHVLLVGDPYQLPPVNHGAVLRDILLAGAPRGELTEIRRNSGAIVAACKAIKDRKRYQMSPRFDLPNGLNLMHVECTTTAAILVEMTKFVRKVISGTKANLDPIDDLQVITVLNDTSPVSRRPLNQLIQSELNPTGHRVPDNPYRVGDKVICLRNGWFFDVKPPLKPTPCLDAERWEKILDPLNIDNEYDRSFVANGDLGRVLAVGPRSMIVSFSLGRTVLIPISASASEDDEPDFDLGYAVTVHKFQGSQCKAVVFIADPDRRASVVGSRELLYTAFSRAELMSLILGKRNLMDSWCQKECIFHRRTLLREKIAAGMTIAPHGAEIKPYEVVD